MHSQNRAGALLRLALRFTASYYAKFAKPVSKLPDATKAVACRFAHWGRMPDSGGFEEKIAVYVQAQYSYFLLKPAVNRNRIVKKCIDTM